MPAAGTASGRGRHIVGRGDGGDDGIVPEGGRADVVGLTDVQWGCQKCYVRKAFGRYGRGGGYVRVGDFHEAPFNGMYCVPRRRLSDKPFCMTVKSQVNCRVIAFVINGVINSRVQKSSVFDEPGASLQIKLLGRKSPNGV